MKSSIHYITILYKYICIDIYITYVLLEYRYMDDVTGNLCVVLLNMMRGFECVCEIISD